MNSSQPPLDGPRIENDLFGVLAGQAFSHPVVLFGQGLALVTLGASLDDPILSFGGWLLFVLTPLYYVAVGRQLREKRQNALTHIRERPWDREEEMLHLTGTIQSIGTFQVIATALAIVLTLFGVWLQYGLPVTVIASGAFVLVLIFWWASQNKFPSIHS